MDTSPTTSSPRVRASEWLNDYYAQPFACKEADIVIRDLLSEIAQLNKDFKTLLLDVAGDPDD